MQRISHLIGIGLVLLVLVLVPHAVIAQYSITDLGTLPGGNYRIAYGINNAGQVVGEASTSSGVYHAFLWQGGVMTDLGTLGGASSTAVGINNLGQIAGHSETSGGATDVFLSSGSSLVDLGIATVDSYVGVNDYGQVVGVLVANHHAFLWTPNTPNGLTGTLVDLGTLGGAYSQAISINEQGHISGNADTSSGAIHAFLWISDTPNGATGHFQDLGTLPGYPSSLGYGLNNADTVSGKADGPPVLFQNGTVTSLGTFGGAEGLAHDINESGLVVGRAQTSNGVEHAFRWDSVNGLLDLNNLISSGSGWVLNEAFSLKDSGQIVGGGMINGQTHGFLLIPAPTLSSLSPNSANAAGPAFTLTVKGASFDSNAVMHWTRGATNTALATTYVSSTQLKASVPASLIATAGKAYVSVVAGNGAVSNAKPFTIKVTTLQLSAATLTKTSTGTYTANITLKNVGYLGASNVAITKASLGLATTSTTLPVSLGSLAAGASGQPP